VKTQTVLVTVKRQQSLEAVNVGALDGGVESTGKRLSNSAWGSMEHLEEKIEAGRGLWTMNKPILGKKRDNYRVDPRCLATQDMHDQVMRG
jgi:hypothetical protein